jgi:signal transduction histidine kinase
MLGGLCRSARASSLGVWGAMTRKPGPEGHPYVLYVDDEPANLSVFKAALGHRLPVLTANSAAEGLLLLEQHEVAVLLSDQRMPGQTGVELLAAARLVSPDTVRMLVTAYSDLKAAIDAINDGFVRRYIRKPWTSVELATTIRDAYSVYQTEASLRALEKRLLQTERFYALGVVAAGIAHELRNPATWLSTSAELCARQIEEQRQLLVGGTSSLDEQLRGLARLHELVSHTNDGAERILDIVASVDVSTRSRPPLERVDLRTLVDATLRLVETQFGRSVRIERETDDWPVIRGSRTALGQVISNVLVNAAQAAEKRADARVVLRSRVEESVLSIEVDDNGDGIPADALPRIFDPFFSLKDDGGTGLGLAISRRIAREHGGDLSAENLPGGGARFRLSLPLDVSVAATG